MSYFALEILEGDGRWYEHGRYACQEECERDISELWYKWNVRARSRLIYSETEGNTDEKRQNERI